MTQHETDHKTDAASAEQDCCTPGGHCDTGAGDGSHAHAEHGHGAGGGHDHCAHAAVFRKRFWICLVLTIPTLIFSPGLQELLGLAGPRFEGSQWIPAAFGILIFGYGGWVFLKGGLSELRAKAPGMMTLISLGILVAFGYSLAVTLGLPGMDFWWELATLVTIMLLGHWIEMSAVMKAQSALDSLAALLPDEAEVLRGEQAVKVPAASLVVDDLVLVRPGGAIPADGEIIEGDSDVDESLLTGESVPVQRGVGSRVVAGSISSDALTVRVTRTGANTALAGIMRMVKEAQQSKSSTQLLADRAAGWLFYFAVGAALITAAVWLLVKPDDLGFVLERVVTVLVIACPHALGLAIPLVAQISTAIGAKNGLLIRDRLAFEEARSLDAVMFDKTGTLTEGRQGVNSVVGDSEMTVHEDELLALAAAVEARTEHPIGRAIVAEAKARGLRPARATEFRSLAGRGVSATVDGRVLRVVSQRVLTEQGLAVASVLVNAARESYTRGHTVVYLLEDDQVLGLIALSDVVRADSAEALSMLRKRGLRVAMITGDSHSVARAVAEQLSVDEVFAEVLPDQKAQAVRQLQVDGSRVAMVGDGVNDAPALAQANVGIAIGAGTDVAIASAGIVLASSDPRGVGNVLTLARASYRKMVQNLWWAAGYNILAVPLAAGLFSWAGFTLSPALGAVLMSLSTVIVALNAQLLRRVSLVPLRDAAPDAGIKAAVAPSAETLADDEAAKVR